GADAQVILMDRANDFRRVLHRGARPRPEGALGRDAPGHIDAPALQLRAGGAVEQEAVATRQAIAQIRSRHCGSLASRHCADARSIWRLEGAGCSLLARTEAKGEPATATGRR